jgi:hypothetical protein
LVAEVSPISRAEWNISPLNFLHSAGAKLPAPPRSEMLRLLLGDTPPPPNNPVPWGTKAIIVN